MPKTQSSPISINDYLPVKVFSEYSGYNIQYIRRLLRAGRLPVIMIGQLWLIEKYAFDQYLSNA